MVRRHRAAEPHGARLALVETLARDLGAVSPGPHIANWTAPGSSSGGPGSPGTPGIIGATTVAAVEHQQVRRIHIPLGIRSVRRTLSVAAS